MKRTILIPVILLGLGHLPEAVGQNTDTVITWCFRRKFQHESRGRYHAVEINLDINKLDVDANRAVLLTPRLVNGTDSLDLPSVGIYGRRRYYYYVRNGIGSISGENETVYRASGKPNSLAYNNLTEYEDWMDGTQLNSTAAIGGVVTRYWRNTKAYWDVIEKLLFQD
ncbi:MAG: DUF3868 domain-containing protein [Alistipes indistinctus]